jgi:hypothetical protein
VQKGILQEDGKGQAWEPVAHRPAPGLSTDALKSAQNLVTAVVPGERLGHGQAQNLSRLEPGADAAAAALTSGLTAGEPPGVLSAGSGC